MPCRGEGAEGNYMSLRASASWPQAIQWDADNELVPLYEDKTVSLKEVAARLGVHLSTVYRHVRSGEIPTRRILSQLRTS